MDILVSTIINLIVLILFAFTLYFAWAKYQSKVESKNRRRISNLNRQNKQLTERLEAAEKQIVLIETVNRTNSAQLTKTPNIFDKSEQRHVEQLKQVVSVNGKAVAPTG